MKVQPWFDGDDSVATGAGNDDFFWDGFLDDNDMLDAGAGMDRLFLEDGVTLTAANNLTGFERYILRSPGDGSDFAFTLDHVAYGNLLECKNRDVSCRLCLGS